MHAVPAVEEKLASGVLQQEEKTQLDRARELLSHAEPDASWAQIISRLASEVIKHRDPIEKQKRTDARSVTLGGKRTVILVRSNGQCEHLHHETGRRCESRLRIEVDHIKPKAFGGGDEIENLRALCRKHNVLAAETAMGWEKANAWRKA